MVHLTVDNQPIEVEVGTTVIEAAQALGIDIPTLCYLKEVNVPVGYACVLPYPQLR